MPVKGPPEEQATLEALHSRLVALVSDATGPWRGSEYLQALGSTSGPSRFSPLFPKPLQPGNPDQHRIGMSQAFFKQEESSPTRTSQSERDLMKNLPYQ